MEDEIPDLYLPRCDCGGVLEFVHEEPEVRLACGRCGTSVIVKDAMRREQSDAERRVYV